MAATFLAFLPALQNDWVDWDDTDNFLRNSHYRGLEPEHLRWMFSTFHMGHYQPIAWLTLGFDATWGERAFGPHPKHGPGMNARAYHLTNNLLHTVNAALVYLLALRLLTWPTIDTSRWPRWLLHVAAAMAALIFAIHPLRVENVAWITERRDLVSALLLLVTVLAWLRAVRPGQPRYVFWLVVAIVVYGISLMGKVAGVPLIAVLLALDWHPLRRLGTPSNPLAGLLTRQPARPILEKLPFVALALLFSAIATIGQAANNWIFPFEKHPLSARLVQCFYGLVFYLWKFVWPFDLLPLYELRLPMRFTLVHAACIILVLAGAVVVWLFRRRVPALLTAMVCYVALLGPVLGLFQNGPQIVADRYTYLPMIGLSMLCAAGWLRWLNFRGSARFAAIALPVFVLPLLGWLTWRQTQVWRDTASLWTYNCAADPQSSYSQNGYGYVLLSSGQPAKAIEHLREAIQLNPQNRKAHENLWNALRTVGDFEQLAQAHESAVADPLLATSVFDSAVVSGNQLLQSGRADLAMGFYELATRIQPQNAQIHTNLGLALARSGRRSEAAEAYARAIQIDPRLFAPRYNAALNYRALNRLIEAREQLQVALELNPSHQGAKEALLQLSTPSQPH